MSESPPTPGSGPPIKRCPCGCDRPLPTPPEGLRWEGAAAVMEQWVESVGLTMADVKAPDRRPAMVQLRREIAFYMRAHHWTLPAIGEFLDRDHTTILSLVGTRSSNLLKLEAARRANG